jgi:sterol 14-demethylase
MELLEQLKQGQVNPLLFIPLGLGLLVAVYYLKIALRPSNSPPVVHMGIPIIGNLLAFISSPVGLMTRAYKEYGPIFSVPIFGNTMTFLVGTEAVDPFFSLSDDFMSQKEVYGFMKPVFGPGIVYDAPEAKRKQQMTHMAKGLRVAMLRSYVPKIQRETEEFLRKWGNEGEVDILEALSELTILTSTRCLHGDDVRENMFSEVAQLYNDIDKGITPISFFWSEAPIPAHKKRAAARKQMVALFSKVIKARREKEDTSDHTDILQSFIEFQYKDGTRLTDDEITGLLIALLFAGQHTSSITSTWITHCLLHNPEAMQRVMEEQAEIVGEETELTFNEHVNQFTYLTNAIREGLRLFPPLIMLMRYARKDIPVTIEGKTYVIPKGDMCVVPPGVHGRDPKIFTNPDAFDPDRYGPERAEDKQKFAYLGFGAGMHACMGQAFGLMQVKTIMSILLRNFDLEATVDELPSPDYRAMVVGPTPGVIVRYRKKATSYL